MKSRDFDLVDEKHRGKVNQWSLCLGAGITRDIVPTWFELTRRVVRESFDRSISRSEFEDLKSDLGWSLDSWIQAAANRYQSGENNLSDFHGLLEHVLYGDLLGSAEQYGLRDEMATALNNPRHVKKDQTIELAGFLEDEYGDTSLLRTAKLLIECANKDRLPQAILTFNADTLLHTAIEIIQRDNHYSNPPPHGHPEYHFTPILRTMAGKPEVKIPIYHIHGAIKPGTERDVTKSYDSRDKLVFLEDDYLNVSSGGASWPQTIFMYHSQVSSLIFVGLSMSDSNIRRWLSSSNEIMSKDIRKVSGVENFAPQHIWVTSKPESQVQKEAKSIGLRHLGVRVGWLSNWSKLGAGLRNLIAL